MNKKRVVFCITLIALIFSENIFAMGIDESHDLDKEKISNTNNYITIIDSYDNTVKIEKPINRIVVNEMGGAFAALRSLDAENLIVAGSSYVKLNEAFFPEFEDLPIISDESQTVNDELIIQLEPDLILSKPSFATMISDVVKDEIAVVQLSFNSVEAYRKLGNILDKNNKANEFISWIESYTDIIDQRISTLSEEEYTDVFAYYGGEYGITDPPPYGTFGKENSLRNDLIKRAGGRSITSELSGDWITVDAEWIIKQNPKLILRECYVYKSNPELGYSINDTTNAKKLLNSILNDQVAFQNSDAVKNNNVHLIYGDLIEDSWFISLIYMAKWFHPDMFADLDPVKMHQEYLTRFQHLNYDLETQGVFSYSSNQKEI
ncbi:MAG: ABC transporter substrate-binding protein [Pleomorphochaeta sp.]